MKPQADSPSHNVWQRGDHMSVRVGHRSTNYFVRADSSNAYTREIRTHKQCVSRSTLQVSLPQEALSDKLCGDVKGNGGRLISVLPRLFPILQLDWVSRHFQPVLEASFDATA